MNYWVVKGNPTRNDWDRMLKPSRKWTWETGRVSGDWQEGDLVFCWESGSKKRIIGLAEFSNPDCGLDENGHRLFELRCLTKRLPVMLTIDELRKHRQLRGASFLKAGPATTVFPLLNRQGEFLLEMVRSTNSSSINLLNGVIPIRPSRDLSDVLPKGIIDFYDSKGSSLHGKFQRWRKQHLRGYFLSLKTKSRSLLHRAECNHPGSVTWNGIAQVKGKTVKHSLTKLRKVCCLNQVELLSWAHSNNISYRSCKHCLPGGPTSQRLKIAPSSAYLLTHERAARPGKLRIALPKHTVPPTTQGFKLDAAQRRAIEDRGVTVAIEHYRKHGFHVEKRGKPYDILCTKGREKVFVEVKATQGSAKQIILTKNEVTISRRFATRMHLAIVTGIHLDKRGRAMGGTLRIIRPWRVQESLLSPFAYMYRLGAHQ